MHSRITAAIAASFITAAGCSGTSESSITPAHTLNVAHSTAASATETVLHSFGYQLGPDGYYPEAGLTNLNGTLYGTTSFGGGHRTIFDGTVYSITPSGTYNELYRFSSAERGGYNLWAGLTTVGDALFGAAVDGGGNGGNGTVFKITPSKKVTLYRFMAPPDGSEPFTNLT